MPWGVYNRMYSFQSFGTPLDLFLDVALLFCIPDSARNKKCNIREQRAEMSGRENLHLATWERVNPAYRHTKRHQNSMPPIGSASPKIFFNILETQIDCLTLTLPEILCQLYVW